MISEPFHSRIDAFVHSIDEPYVLVEQASPDEVAHVRTRYLPRVLALSLTTKERILAELEASWASNQDHAKIRHWGRAASGFAQFLLRPASLAETDGAAAADVVIRISRWRHTPSNLWIRFQPHARRVVDLAWGEIEYFR